MSYLELKNGIPDFNKLIMSLWFRIPRQTMAATSGFIPLMTFGRTQQKTPWSVTYVSICTPLDAFGPFMFGFDHLDKGTPINIEPCSIFVNCTSADSGVLEFHFQMPNADKATGVGVGPFSDTKATGFYPVDAPDGTAALIATPGSGWSEQHNDQTDEDGIVHPHAYYIQSDGIKDFSKDVLNAEPELFHVKTLPKVTPDQWHHLLFSIDISTAIATHGPDRSTDLPDEPVTSWDNVSEGTTKYGKMWFALDDVDYRGRGAPGADGNPTYHFGPYSVDYDVPLMGGGLFGDPNGILTKKGWEVAKNGTNALSPSNHFRPVPTYNFAPSAIPSLSSATDPAKTAPFGIPSTTTYLSGIYQVEMAELQIWTGRTLDTGELANRRLFISEEGKPVPSGTAANELGKQTVMLHGSGNWIKGRNTGSTGIDDAGAIIAEGQFERVARIDRWRPSPSLHGPQMPKEKAPA